MVEYNILGTSNIKSNIDAECIKHNTVWVNEHVTIWGLAWMRQANKRLRFSNLAYLTQGNDNTEKVFKFSMSAHNPEILELKVKQL